MAIFRVLNLKKEYPQFALRDISFEVESGHIVGLIGRNGAGKTTIIKSIMNLIPCSGEIYFFNKLLKEDEREIKENIGLVSGGFDFFPQKTLSQIVNIYSLFYSKWDNILFENYANKFNLNTSKKVCELSEGMKVKFSIALALSHNAKFLILDEPTSGLDPLSRDEFCDIILDLAKNKYITVLFSTHITSDLMKIADDIIYICDGELVANSSLSSFMAKYKEITFSDKNEADNCNAKLIGLKPIKNGYSALIYANELPYYGKISDAELDSIIIHLEHERRKNNA